MSEITRTSWYGSGEVCDLIQLGFTNHNGQRLYPNGRVRDMGRFATESQSINIITPNPVEGRDPLRGLFPDPAEHLEVLLTNEKEKFSTAHRKIVAPIIVEGNHFVLVLLEPETKTVAYVDSRGLPPSKEISDAIQKVYPEATIAHNCIRQQDFTKNAWDCGPLVIQNATDILTEGKVNPAALDKCPALRKEHHQYIYEETPPAHIKLTEENQYNKLPKLCDAIEGTQFIKSVQPISQGGQSTGNPEKTTLNVGQPPGRIVFKKV